MRILQIALFIICINFGINIALGSTLYDSGFYSEPTLTTEQNITGEVDFLSDTEQLDASIRGLRKAVNLVKWNWLEIPFQLFMTEDSAGMQIVSSVVTMANIITGLLILVGIIQFVRNLITTL